MPTTLRTSNPRKQVHFRDGVELFLMEIDPVSGTVWNTR
jgi:hypothetical protein